MIRLLTLACLLVPAALSQTLTITAPANNTQVQPGQTVKFTVTLNPASDFGAVLLYGSSPLGLLGGQVAAASLSFSATLPGDLRPASYPVTAIGYTNTGSAVISQPVTLQVAIAPNSLTVTPGQMFFTSIGAQLPGFAGGTLADGTHQDFTESPLVTWTSGNIRVATVGTDGVVTAVGNGTTTVTASYGGVSDVIRVRVNAPSSPCTYNVDTVTANVGPPGGPVTVNVTASAASCEWSVVSWAPWITISPANLARGSGPVTMTVAVNTGATRTATVAIAGQNVTVSQAGSTGVAVVPGTVQELEPIEKARPSFWNPDSR